MSRVPKDRGKAPALPDQPADFRSWKARVTAALGRRRGVRAAALREGMLKRLYIRRGEPEAAAAEVDSQYHASRSARERQWEKLRPSKS